MSTAVATKSAKLPEAANLPELTERVSTAIWRVTAGLTPHPAAKVEAQTLLEMHGPKFAAARETQIGAWLTSVNLATSKPISVDDFRIRSPEIIDGLRALPAALFTAETAAEAKRHFQWFPGAAEVAEFLAPRLTAVRKLQWDLRRVANHGNESSDNRPPPTDEERAVVASITGQLSALRSPDAARPVNVKPAPLSGYALAEARTRLQRERGQS